MAPAILDTPPPGVQPGSSDSPKRDLQAIRSITQIIERFEVVAIQELGGDLVPCPISSLKNPRVLFTPGHVAPPPVGPATLVVAPHPGAKSPVRIIQGTNRTGH